jgi:hypothetical protein
MKQAGVKGRGNRKISCFLTPLAAAKGETRAPPVSPPFDILHRLLTLLQPLGFISILLGQVFSYDHSYQRTTRYLVFPGQILYIIDLVFS